MTIIDILGNSGPTFILIATIFSTIVTLGLFILKGVAINRIR